MIILDIYLSSLFHVRLIVADQKRGSSKSPDVTPQGCYATNFGMGVVGGMGNVSAPAATTGSATTATTTTTAESAATATSTPAVSAGTGSVGPRFRSIESQILSYAFKGIVTRCVLSLKELKSVDNITLYCDLKQMMTYVQEAHGGVFRRVALSGILDSTDRPNKRCNGDIQTTRVIRSNGR